MLPKSSEIRMMDADKDVVYYVAGYIARSIKKSLKCDDCSKILGEDSEIDIKINGVVPQECHPFVDTIL